MTLFYVNKVNFMGIINYPQIEMPREKLTFICGESGCGKSTLLKLLNGVISADSGEIYYNGKQIQSYDPIELRKEVSLISQSVFLFDKSIRDNFYEYYDYRDLQKPSDEYIKEYLDICCADFRLESLCSNLSGGEKQRVYIGIFLSLKPRVLLLDEPTSALDDYHANALLSNIKAYSQKNGLSLVVVSHNKQLANSYADNIITIKKDELA